MLSSVVKQGNAGRLLLMFLNSDHVSGIQNKNCNGI